MATSTRKTTNVMADRIYRGGTILTMNDAQPQVEALAIRGKRILVLGTWEELQGLVDGDTDVVDLGGRTLVPGFIDAHGRPTGVVEEEAVNAFHSLLPRQTYPRYSRHSRSCSGAMRVWVLPPWRMG